MTCPSPSADVRDDPCVVGVAIPGTRPGAAQAPRAFTSAARTRLQSLWPDRRFLFSGEDRSPSSTTSASTACSATGLAVAVEGDVVLRASTPGRPSPPIIKKATVLGVDGPARSTLPTTLIWPSWCAWSPHSSGLQVVVDGALARIVDQVVDDAPCAPPLNSGLRSTLCAYRLPKISTSLTLSWISVPFECSPFSWLELLRPSAIRLLLKVMRCEVPLRHSSASRPRSAGPRRDRFSSVPRSGSSGRR